MPYPIDNTSYRELAARLDALPNGFPPAADGAEMRLLAALFAPEEAALAAQLKPSLETPAEIAARLSGDLQTLRKQLKSMASRGLIAAGRAPAGGLGFGLLPFVVGIYEFQAGRIDAELARLFEDYYGQTFRQALALQPPAHRVIPVGASLKQDLEVRPFESAADIIRGAKAWGVTDCICRKQQALLGQPCGHPLDVCMVFSDTPGAFDHKQDLRAQTQEEALATLRRAAEAGLVHSVSNTQRGLWYLCNCCACACGFLRGLAALGAANVVARSAFACRVDEAKCAGCGECAQRCAFGALTITDHGVARVDAARCAGCGVCVPACPNDALALARRPEVDIAPIPDTEADWRRAREAGRRG